MRLEHVRYLACPACKGDLTVDAAAGPVVEEGELRCASCAAAYPVRGGIPRFVPPENYAANFGHQWLIHRDTQLDDFTGTDASRRRFFEETRWPERLEGQVVLEVGSGAGRFTGFAAATGAMVISLDYSQAVEANRATNGHHPNLLIVQGDVYALPVRPGSVDRTMCLGVVQHTPDPARTFQCLADTVRPGGTLAIDVYAKRWYTPLVTRYWARTVTRRMQPERLYRWVKGYVTAAWPVARQLAKLPGGRHILTTLLIHDNGRYYPLSDEKRREWAVLDTYDALAPAYDLPQSLRTVRRWFARAGFEQVDVHNGWNGVEGRGVRPALPERAAEAAD